MSFGGLFQLIAYGADEGSRTRIARRQKTHREYDFQQNKWLRRALKKLTKDNANSISCMMEELDTHQIHMVQKYLGDVIDEIYKHPDVLLWTLTDGFRYKLIVNNRILIRHVIDHRPDRLEEIIQAAKSRNIEIYCSSIILCDVYNYSENLVRGLIDVESVEKYIRQFIQYGGQCSVPILDILVEYVNPEHPNIYIDMVKHPQYKYLEIQQWVCQRAPLQYLAAKFREKIRTVTYVNADGADDDDAYIELEAVDSYRTEYYSVLEPYIVAKMRALRAARRWRKIVQARRAAHIHML